jgi:hypothetical protein
VNNIKFTDGYPGKNHEQENNACKHGVGHFKQIDFSQSAAYNTFKNILGVVKNFMQVIFVIRTSQNRQAKCYKVHEIRRVSRVEWKLIVEIILYSVVCYYING